LAASRLQLDLSQMFLLIQLGFFAPGATLSGGNFFKKNEIFLLTLD
jgi:hypothetical protein